MPDCVIVDLQGNVVVQEPSAAQPTPGQYLVEVRVNQGASQVNNQSDGTFGSIHLKDREGCCVDEKKKAVIPIKAETTIPKLSNGVKTQEETEPEWSFQPVVMKEKEVTDEGEANRPRRTSAKKARLRWKTIHEENTSKGCVKKARRVNVVRDRNLKRTDELVDQASSPEPPVDLPVWARGLGCVRVEGGQWVQGVADSRHALQDILDIHSRAVLCDYIRSHPSNLEKRHRLRDQRGRLMWRHRSMAFHTTPFTITASHQLRCAFSMNYKLKRKENSVSKALQQNTDEEGEARGEEGCEERGREEEGKVEGRNMEEAPKKKYKSVTFTSCPARIMIKDIVKYPGYAVSPNALSSERKATMKALRMDMKRGVDVEKEEVFHITLPLHTLHNHPLSGRSRGIHHSIVTKIRELVSGGITAPKAIKTVLDKHVVATFSTDLVVPSLDDRAFYPRLKDIANLVYCHCRRMGISAKRKTSHQNALDQSQHKRRKKQSKSECEEGERELGGSESAVGSVPLQASTLQEAVQTFCTDDSDRASLGGLEGRECIPSEAVGREVPQDASGLADLVRGQLETLRGLTYSMQGVSGLQELYQSLQVLINQYVSPSHPSLQEGMTETPAATAFIIQDPLVDQLGTTSTPAEATTTEHLAAISERDANTETAAKPRTAHGIVSTQHLRQLRTPVALQCMVPTLVSQLPRTTTTQNPQQHIVNPVHTTPAVATPVPPPPTYQTLGPVAQDGSQAGPPVHVSIPPYFYYVQEVTVPDSNQTWTYTTTS